MSIVRVRLPDGRASQLDLGSMPPLVYAQQLANASKMYVEYSVQDTKGSWSEFLQVYPTVIIVPITPTVALSMHEAQADQEG